MASSLFVNTLQVNFASVLAMEYAGMVRMFKYLKDTGLRGFLEGTTYVFESAVTEFFSNARVLAGTTVSTVCGQKLVVTEENFSATFKLPTEGMANFAGIQKETIAEMKYRFSATEVPFKFLTRKENCSSNIVYCTILLRSLYKSRLAPEGETNQRTEDTTSNTEGGASQSSQPVQLMKEAYTISMPLRDFVKRKQTERQHTQLGWTAAKIVSQPDPTPDNEWPPLGNDDPLVGPGEPATIELNQSIHGRGEENFEEGQNSNTRKEHEEQQEPEITADGKDGSPYASIPTIPVNGEGNVDDQHIATGSQEPVNVVAEVRLRDISSVESLVQIEDQLLEWWETEEISDFFERHSLIIYKLFELKLEKLYHEHLAHFNLDVPSVHRDFECIRRLHKELKVAAAVHRNHRLMAGLPLTSQGISSSYHQEQLPTLEFSRWVDHDQDRKQAGSHQIELPGKENTAMTFHEHQDQETKPTIQTDETQNEGNEHQAPAEPRSALGIDQNLEDRSAITPLAQIVLTIGIQIFPIYS
ncbi:hypothetical protein F511_10509 [Dorcoceras hygrometricum]|uniref:Uncharacterized protein n=1 Tax=Dorcoceras hygrometricum TaxID=472368 RepID=A0A2Z7AD79_9LAMI|nr:hypothetical protein F511_10509 [Dorcoceras hygrometricum]